MQTPRLAMPLSALFLLALCSTASSQVVFEDGEFTESDWTWEVLLDSTPGGAVANVATLPSGGNPGNYRESYHEYAEGTIQLAHFNPLEVYDPSVQGPIGSIDFSYDLINLGTDLFAVRYRLLLFQGGEYFVSVAGDAIFSGGWHSFAHSGQKEEDFVDVTEFETGTLHPDFSADGEPIVLGFRTSNYHEQSNTQYRWSGIDNWRVEIHEPPVPIRETTWGRVKTTP